MRGRVRTRRTFSGRLATPRFTRTVAWPRVQARWLPAGKFNANAAWLDLAVMAFNLTRAAATGTVVGVFPNPEALLRCAGDVLIEAMPRGKSSSTDASFGIVRLSRHRLVLSVWGIGLGHDCVVRPDGGKPCPAEGNWPRWGAAWGIG